MLDLRRGAASLAVAVSFFAAEAASGQCAPPAEFNVPTGRTHNLCFSRGSLTIPSTSISNATSLWSSGCTEIGTGIPNMVANPTNTLTCDLTISVTYSSSAHPNGWSASFSWTENSSNVITGGTITCHVNVCTDTLLAHEMGHALGLENSTDSSCAGSIMYFQNPGTNFSDACSTADDFWTGPSTSDATGTGGGQQSGGGGGGGGGGEDNQCEENCSPLVLDLDGDGVHTTSVHDGPVSFDMNGDGNPEWLGWTDPATEEGLLWLDLDTNHRVDDGRELFGVGTLLPDGSRAIDGFEALRVYDHPAVGGNGDGAITVADAIWGRLRVWVDRNHDAVSQPDETGPIHRYGVVSLSLHYTVDETPDPSGNLHRYRGSYLRRVVTGGPARYETRALDDVFFLRLP